MTKSKSPSLPELKHINKGVSGALTEDGLFYIVVDTKVPIGTSKHGNTIFALTNGVCGTPFGQGIMLSLMVGKINHATK